MSHFTSSISGDGPLLNVQVAVSAPRRAALDTAKMNIPTPMRVQLLIDTGASITSIDHSIVSGLLLQPTGSIKMHTPSTGQVPVSMPTFDIDIILSGGGGASHIFPTLAVVGCDFSGQGIHGLLGRDALELARLFYSGPDNAYYLSF